MTASLDAAEERLMMRWQKQHRTRGKPPIELWHETLKFAQLFGGLNRPRDEALKTIARHTQRSVPQVEAAFARVREHIAKIDAKRARSKARAARAKAKTTTQPTPPSKPPRTVTLHIGKAQVTGTADDVLHILKQMERQ
jgi:hypothetical protein